MVNRWAQMSWMGVCVCHWSLFLVWRVVFRMLSVCMRNEVNVCVVRKCSINAS